ncbi:hypothetical protein HU230_0011690 [Bradyrhizobium quebecense]|uniref:Uncharacterized protein n=1 Tax=Bradyrhizobium quebecense TaxID=2748629 RepID=A0A973WR60_9BRAD|nr:hypothetical protein [Bradyrhizobium quebecense]UGA46656.1 hypothetical protein HU230_0011690 [Bradyrhizobium quebecense]
MAAFNKFNVFMGDLGSKVHNLTADALKILLTDVAPVATNTVKANLTEIAAGNGYTAGGGAASFTSWTQAAGVWKLVLQPVLFTAAGGNIAQFRYAALYNSTPVNGNLIGWWDYGAEVNLTNGNSFTVQLDTTNGALTLT